MTEDDKIIDLFFERSEKAIDALADRYGTVFLKIAMNALNDRRDAEECVNDAYLAAWNAIPPERPDPLPAFVCRIVRNLSINRFKRNHAQRRKSNYELCLEELEDCVPSAHSVHDAFEQAELSAHIDGFLASVPELDGMLFVRRFFFMDSYRDIAAQTGLSEGAIRTRITRLRKKLKEYLIKEGVMHG